MKIIRTRSAWRAIQSEMLSRQIGLVPTMGSLHVGHMSLIHRAREENDIVALSLFVNPTQFNNAEDFEHYPRNLERDRALAESAGVDYLLMPTVEALYPDACRYEVSEKTSNDLMEGLHRPGHFSGMLTVVLKLLLWIKPCRVYFGEKDYQQLQLVRGLVEAFFLESEVVACPTLREETGLAMSSRNERLSAMDRQKASLLYQELALGNNCDEVKARLSEAGFKVEYVEEHEGRRFIAAWLGGVRLIDNVKVEKVACSSVS